MGMRGYVLRNATRTKRKHDNKRKQFEELKLKKLKMHKLLRSNSSASSRITLSLNHTG